MADLIWLKGELSLMDAIQSGPVAIRTDSMRNYVRLPGINSEGLS